MLKKIKCVSQMGYISNILCSSLLVSGMAHSADKPHQNLNLLNKNCVPSSIAKPQEQLPRAQENAHTQAQWEASIYDHPLRHAAKQGITVDDLENGRIGYEGGFESDECGNVKKVSRVFLIESQIVASDHLANKVSPKPKLPEGVFIEMALFDGIEQKASNASSNTLAVLTFKRPTLPNIQMEIDKAVLEGKIITNKDKREYHQSLIAERKSIISNFLATKINTLKAKGIEILDHGSFTATVTVALNQQQLKSLSRQVNQKSQKISNQITVASVDSTDNSKSLLNLSNLDGIYADVKPTAQQLDSLTIHQGSQIDQYVDRGYQGWGFPSYKAMNGNRLNAAIVEVANGLGKNDHPGFKRSATGNSVIENQYLCRFAGCQLENEIPPGNNHALQVTGVLAGDLTEGQDPTITNIYERKRRSGPAHEPTFDFFFDPSAVYALEQIAENASDYWLVNNSYGARIPCTGGTRYDEAANNLYELGVAVIASAGNTYHDTGDCTTTAPGTAIGTFTVGSHTNGADRDLGTLYTARQGDISTFTARGGDLVGRSVIDITAPGCRHLLYDAAGGYDSKNCGTSFSAPAVSGLALDFINWWHYAGLGTVIEQPGMLYANLLLMADGQKESSNTADQYQEEGFDNLWGAGRLQARMFNDIGMDGPWAWKHGFVCAAEQQNIHININDGKPLDFNVDVIHGVAWWYDRRHQDGTSLDHIDFFLDRRNVFTGNSSLVRSSYSQADNKERVIWQNIGWGNIYKLNIHGLNVTADEAGCGPNKMKVYYAYYYEDTARDDADGPSWSNVFSPGVQPQPKD